MLTSLKNDEELEKFREKFFNFLLKKPCTSGEAEKYLLRHDTPEYFFDILLNEAEKLNLIDDIAYAKLFIDGHLAWGNAKIIYELSLRGVSRDEINEALDYSCDESARARELAENWQKLGVSEQKIKNRLLNRGFSINSINKSFLH